MDSEMGEVGVTRALAAWASGIGACDPATSGWPQLAAAPSEPLAWAKHALLDWLAVTVAAKEEPLVRILREEYGGSAAAGALLVAQQRTGRVQDAALVNGAAGHALDFDDVSMRMTGHPSAPVIPAALAMAEAQRASGIELLRAIVAGHEVAARMGDAMGAAHYRQGFHVTGTIGTLAAAAACGVLQKLPAGPMTHALGLAATQAAGLKVVFGSMAKPLHAGKAAMHGAMAVRLAGAGFTASETAIEGPQGFMRTLAPSHEAFDKGMDLAAGFAIRTTLFKYHAACYLTHAAIEAVARLRKAHAIGLDDLECMHVAVARNHRGVCDIAEPRDGLELKFSIQQLVLLALDGADTAALALYTDAMAQDPRLRRSLPRVTLEFTDQDDEDFTWVKLLTRDGRRLVEGSTVAIPATDLGAQWTRLVAKAEAIAKPVLGAAAFGAMLDAVGTLEQAPGLEALLEAIR